MVKKKPDTYDLVVIGCGAAGLSAAVSYASAAKGRGPRVAVLERAPRENRGGATRWTSSWFRITEDRRLDPEFVGQMKAVSNGMADLDYCETLSREVTETLGFLETNGVELIYFPQPFPNRNTGGGLGMPARGGVGIVDGLAEVVDRTPGIEILYETEALRLSLSDDGRIDGVVTRGRDGLMKRLTAPAVVIACGGFEGNKEMLTQYLGSRACDLPVVAPTLVNNRGEGLRMAIEVGADTAGQFDMFHGEPMDPRSSKPDAVVYGYPFGIVVNGEARRFFDEGKDAFDSTFEELSVEIWRNQNQKAFFIGDQTTLGIEHWADINLTDQPLIEAPTLAELAKKLGLDAEALEVTVAAYNRAIGPGTFNPKIFDGRAAIGLDPPKSNWAFPLERPPFIAYPLTCAITFTFGGIRTNSRAQVVNAAGVPIPGLYAAGEVTGLYYHSYPAGTSVLRAATFGRLAGAHAANEER
jgi:succinate dehydrogenase/fumarate reductase flavoprotein subunit